MELHELMFTAVCVLGFFCASKKILRFCRWVWIMFLRPPKNLKEYGSWAIITGCTDGIGKALAFELASKGLNLVLVGRNPVKLQLISTEIRERYMVDIKSVVIDFAKLSGEELSKVIAEGTEGLDIGILINNVGMAYPSAKFFHEVDQELMESIVKVNIDGATWITKSVLPIMLKKKKGTILNMGSASTVAVSSFPLHALYAATKAYIRMFSRCISLEYKQAGIDIQCQVPMFVATKMVKEFNKVSFFVPSPEMFSKASVRCMGYEDHLCMPYWTHFLQWFMYSLVMPDPILNWWIFKSVLRQRERELLLQKDF